MLYVALIVYLVTAVASAFLCASETAVLMLTPGRVHRLAEAERPGSPALERLSDQRHRMRAVSTLVGGVAFATAAVLGGMLGEVFWASDFGGGTDAVSGTLGAASAIAGAALMVLLDLRARPGAAPDARGREPRTVGVEYGRLRASDDTAAVPAGEGARRTLEVGRLRGGR